MSKAVTLANIASGEAFTIDESNERIGIASTAPSASVDVNQVILLDGNSGVVTATKFVGDGSSLTSINASGLTGTPSITVQDIIAVGATFSGVLTYEDVTNVDSVGIVTAGLGLRVLSGGIQAVGLYTGFHASGISTFKGSLGNITAEASGAELKFSRASLNALTASDGSGYFVVQTGGSNERVRVAANGDITLSGSAVGVSSVTWDASANSFIFKDDSYAKFGDGSDLSLYHTAGASWINNTTGDLILRNSASPGDVYIQAGGAKLGLKVVKDAEAELYFNNNEKLATTNAGVTITGVTTSTAGIHAGPGILRENMRGYGSAMNGAYTADILSTGMVLNAPTNSTATFTINLRGDGSTTFNSLMNSGESTVFTAFVGQNNSSYYLTDFQIDGASITEEWAGGTAPSAGGASGTDIYTFTILKTANATFSVFANVTNFA